VSGGTYILYGRPRWGSAIVEAQLVWYGLPFTFEVVGDLLRDPAARAALEKVNPLAQVPTLVLPDGKIMSESAAITLHLADLTGRNDLVPDPTAQERAGFLRWLVFLVANIYPTFTYGDVPERFVPDAAAAKEFRKTVDLYGERLWRQVEGAASAPWFLGERMTALDMYIAVMTGWRPRRDWFKANVPRITAIAERTEALPELAEMWKRNTLTPA
jgi:GST-like protein